MLNDTLFVKLKFNQTGTQATNAAVQIARIFRGNSVYDPDYTGAGSQPMGYDEWSRFYDFVHVLGSSIKITVMSACDVPVQIGVYPALDVSGSSATSLREIPYCKTSDGYAYGVQGNQWCRLKNYMSTAKIYGISKQEVKDNGNYGHSTATNPVSQWFWHVESQTFGSSVPVTNAVNYDVQITYYCMFKRRIQLQES